jgi:ATP-binding cassette, subfamily B, bacterial
MIPVRPYLRLLATYLRQLRLRVVVLAIGVFGGIALQLLNPQLIKRFIDGAAEGRSASALIPIALLFILVGLTRQVLAIGSTWLAEDVGWRATNQLRSDLTEHVLSLDLGYHKAHPPGELIERVDGDVTNLSNFFSAMMLRVVGNGALLVGIIVMLFLESWIVGTGVAIATVGASIAMSRLHGAAVPWWRGVRAHAAEAAGLIGEQVEGTEDIAANGATTYMQSRFAGVLRRRLPLEVKGWTGWALLWSTSVVLSSVSVILVFIVGSQLLGVGALTIGALYLVFHYTEMLGRPMEEIREQLEDLQKAGAAIARLEELFGTQPRLSTAGRTRLPSGPLSVHLDHVTFAYEDDPDDTEPVLRDVNLEVAPGRIVGVLGRTGSGKSTIARLITRLYDPQEGAVRLGGITLPDVDPDDLRARVRMVTQDVQLFRASVRDNLTFFDPSIDDDRLREVIHRLELDEWLDSLPDGLETQLSGGDGLSAGQAQLLAFTRIFLADPGVVVLDEASSRLDPATEVLIERAVDHLLEDRTGLIIAHRLHTVTRADDILVLEDGRVVEFGDRRMLAADPTSRFARLLDTGMEEVLA